MENQRLRVIRFSRRRVPEEGLSGVPGGPCAGAGVCRWMLLWWEEEEEEEEGWVLGSVSG
ncbi:hypothetical protein D4A39_16765 [Alcanivorax profundi]|uniref:Uncharacterized protein n=1 Tax=Alcanivorax profundi TaxID=2338368 RepID=A0A418XR46_9GAMM|nr:hypothetical protein D4A39_16765 [Alcanivorax profundi]